MATIQAAAAAVADKMTSPWPGQQVRFLNRICLQAGTEEACGLIIGLQDSGTIRVQRLTHCENSDHAPNARFQIPAEHLMLWDSRAQSTGLQIVGAWHSHPAGENHPSPADLVGLPEGWLGIIVVPNATGSPTLLPYGRWGAAPAFVHV